jgi:hypothetical protein
MFHNSRSVAVFTILFALFALIFAPLSASTRIIAQTRSRAATASRKQTRQAPTQEPKQESTDRPSSVKLVEPPRVDYLSGEANVAVSGNQNPVIRLGLSPNGATIIEFPSSDRH